MKIIFKITLIILLLFLGFSPINDPHIVGKIKLLSESGADMRIMDWVDVFVHGGSIIFSFIILISFALQLLKKK